MIQTLEFAKSLGLKPKMEYSITEDAEEFVEKLLDAGEHYYHISECNNYGVYQSEDFRSSVVLQLGHLEMEASAIWQDEEDRYDDEGFERDPDNYVVTINP